MTRMVMLVAIGMAFVVLPTTGFSASNSKPKEIVVVGSKLKKKGGEAGGEGGQNSYTRRLPNKNAGTKKPGNVKWSPIILKRGTD